ncbi:hypothetical protein RchiOBHm_Chr1g0363381 [Rosa chinensis]|uniref:Uncharacterized protein n=1 Tax=Rosa chinensis TaxID=74649 RepID=A0A2P6SJH1_ROSCH|nr:hypothetical protein RchiOBHm_Chr1g0363381 [Rosa chinensis]
MAPITTILCFIFSEIHFLLAPQLYRPAFHNFRSENIIRIPPLGTSSVYTLGFLY